MMLSRDPKDWKVLLQPLWGFRQDIVLIPCIFLEPRSLCRFGSIQVQVEGY